MKSLLLLIFPIIIFSLTVNGQQKGPNISFDSETHNYGKISEAKGPVTHVFNFTNTGAEPLIIQDVTATCGCTTPEWSREPVVPGGKGFIKATFNPTGRPGLFTKTITITSNGLRNRVNLNISGEVIGESTTATKFPFSIDDLKFSSVYISYGKVSPGKLAARSLEVLNTGAAPVNIAFPSVPPHIQIMVTPSTLKPNQKASIDVTFDAKKKNDWGFISEALEYTLNGKKDGKYKINLSATVQDDYSLATPEQLANAPKLILEKNIFDIGRVKAGANVEVSFKFKNMGKSNLEIRKILSSCGCTNVKVKENTIKPGANGEITGVFSSAGQKGAVNKTITVITNDPKNLSLVLWIRGTVE